MAVTASAIANEPISDLNTTPLIDVMLVLLVMFIMVMPMQTHAIKIDLPSTDGTLPPTDPAINRVTVDVQNQVRWNGKPIDLVTLAKLLERTRAVIPSPELYVEPDAGSRYDITHRVLAVIKRSQVGKMGFVGNERYRDFPS